MDWRLIVACVTALLSSAAGVSQVALQYATSSNGPYNRFGVLHIAAIDDDMRSQVHLETLPSTTISSLRQLSHDENNRLYLSVGSDSREKTSAVMTSISLCRLVQTGFAMNLTVTLDATDSIVGLYAHTRTEWCSETTEHSANLETDAEEVSFRVRVITNYCEQGTQPDADRFLSKIEREQFEKEQKGEERGFFAKYWMYIVPAVILYLVVMQQPGEGGASGGGGRG